VWENKIYIFGGTVWLDGKTWSGAKLFSNTSTAPIEIASEFIESPSFPFSFSPNHHKELADFWMIHD